MNKSKLTTGALLVVLLLLAGGCFLIFGDSLGLAAYANADKYTVGDADISSAVENLEIDWISGKVNIQYHAGSGISLSETANRNVSEDEKFRWWLDGKTLRIQFAAPKLFSFNNLQKTLTVSLPEGIVFKSVNIETTSGDISVPAMTADELRFDTTSGDVNAVITAKNLNASSTSGDMEIRQDSDIRSAILGSTSGNITLSAVSAENIDMKSTSGNLSLTLAGDVKKLHLDSTSGAILADLASADKAEFDSTSGNMNVTLQSFSDLDLDATSGDITLKLPKAPGFTLDLDSRPSHLNSALALEKNGSKYTYGDGSARLRIETTSGNIRIEE